MIRLKKLIPKRLNRKFIIFSPLKFDPFFSTKQCFPFFLSPLFFQINSGGCPGLHVMETGQDYTTSEVSSSFNILHLGVALHPIFLLIGWLEICLKHQNCLLLSSQSYGKPSLIVTPSTEADRKKTEWQQIGSVYFWNSQPLSSL